MGSDCRQQTHARIQHLKARNWLSLLDLTAQHRKTLLALHLQSSRTLSCTETCQRRGSWLGWKKSILFDHFQPRLYCPWHWTRWAVVACHDAGRFSQGCPCSVPGGREIVASKLTSCSFKCCCWATWSQESRFQPGQLALLTAASTVAATSSSSPAFEPQCCTGRSAGSCSCAADAGLPCRRCKWAERLPCSVQCLPKWQQYHLHLPCLWTGAPRLSPPLDSAEQAVHFASVRSDELSC